MINNGITIGGRHSRDYFKMLPKNKLVFAPPKIKTKTVDVWGMDGVLDYTEVLTDRVIYQNRKGMFEFYAMTDMNYQAEYSELMTFFNGSVRNAILDDSPNYFYRGRFIVNNFMSFGGKEGSKVVIEYDVEPYKYPIDHSLSHDWLWNDLFSNIIYYGIFDVSGSVARNLINPSGSSITPKFTCSSAMTVTKGGSTYSLPAGTTTSPGFNLSSGDNQMTFTGNGRVEVDYSLGNKEL